MNRGITGVVSQLTRIQQGLEAQLAQNERDIALLLNLGEIAQRGGTSELSPAEVSSALRTPARRVAPVFEDVEDGEGDDVQDTEWSDVDEDDEG